MYFDKNIIFSLIFFESKAFDVIEFKTKTPGKTLRRVFQN